MSIDILPAELQLEIASYLQLRELILLRNASKHWQALINNNLSFIRRARQELHRLWDDTIHSPYFLPSRARVLPALRPFDRIQYLHSLSCGLPLPEEFELWVLEWPAKAVIGWTWPGLDNGLYAFSHHLHASSPPPMHAWWQLHGTNPLFASSPYSRAESVFTLSAETATIRPGYEDYWRAIGLAIPVWSLQPDYHADADGSRNRLVAHMLIVRGAGGQQGGAVLPFNVRIRRRRRRHLGGDGSGFHCFATPPCGERDCERCARYNWIWWKAEVDESVRAASWTAWLRCCLRALEANYLFHWAASEDEAYWTMVDGAEEFVFREVDLEHFPKGCEIDGVAYRLGGVEGASGWFHELFEPELRAV
ncbi:putative f-box domain cyclin-like protein [Lasiodiplodia theobromae]|nr:putative f-box domain cyclin-like protein [Lasiodiplodia theobromae]